MQLHYQYAEQFLTAYVPMSLTVVLHGQGMRLAALYLRRFGKRASHNSSAPLLNMVLVATVAIMLLTHFIEINVWAMFYFLTRMLPGRCQGLDGVEAMTAMLMFGWSTAVMANVVQKTNSIDDSTTVPGNG